MVKGGLAQVIWTVLKGAAFGATVLSAISWIAYLIQDFTAGTRSDGQFVVLFIIAIPIGAVLGASINLSKEMASKGRARAAGVLAIAAGAIPGVAIWAWLLPDHINRIWTIWAGVPFACALGVVIYGFFLTAARRK